MTLLVRPDGQHAVRDQSQPPAQGESGGKDHLAARREAHAADRLGQAGVHHAELRLADHTSQQHLQALARQRAHHVQVGILVRADTFAILVYQDHPGAGENGIGR